MVVAIKNDIRWFEIAVQHALRMRVMDRLCDGARVCCGALRGEWSVADHLGECPPLHEIHGKVMVAVPFPGLMDADNVRMLQMSGGFRLAAKTQHILFAGELPCQNHFERN